MNIHGTFGRSASIAVLSTILGIYLYSHGVALPKASGAAIVLCAILAAVWLLEGKAGTAASGKPKGASFDWGMHYLRGFAIVCIMLTHLWGKLGLTRVSSALLAGSTVYFLFISGYLCQYLALRRPIRFWDYMRTKIENVVCPYWVWTGLTLVLMLLLRKNRGGVIPLEDIVLRNLPNIFLLGWAQGTYWYIPFVVFLFLASPWLSRCKTPVLVWISATSFFTALCLPFRPPSHLTWEPILWLLRFTYFTWCYLAGFLYARFKETVDRHLAAYAVPAFALAVILGLRLFAPDVFALDPTTLEGLEGENIPVVVLGGALAKSLQKFLFLVPVVVVANHFKSRRIALFDALATYSFTLFFTHYFFVNDYVILQRNIFRALEPGLALRCATYVGLSVCFMTQNLLLAILMKAATGRKSRSFIGS